VSYRPTANFLVIFGLLLFSVLGYVALQQFVERTNAVSRNTDIPHSTDYEVIHQLPVIKPTEWEAFKKAHSDGLPVDYLSEISPWPNLKSGFEVYRYNEGCVVNSRPKETCSTQTYVALDSGKKKVILVTGQKDLSQIFKSIETKDEALAVVTFLSSWEYAQYFGVGFTNLNWIPDELEEKKPDSNGFYLQEKVWRRLGLPEPKVSKEKGEFFIERVGFVPYGEKQIIKVKETLTSDGKYTYDIGMIMHRGTFVPIDTKNL
jgi:hypothetical protein